jgi:hypothetical protein
VLRWEAIGAGEGQVCVHPGSIVNLYHGLVGLLIAIAIAIAIAIFILLYRLHQFIKLTQLIICRRVRFVKLWTGKEILS